MKETILIVEDQFVEANNLRLILRNEGYRILPIAVSYDEAITALEHEVPDLVLLDIFLKGKLTGIDLAQKLNDENIPFIYLSANSDRQTLEAAKLTNPYGFLVKPFKGADVLVMMEIARHRHQHGVRSLHTPQRVGNKDKKDLSHSYAFGIIGRNKKLQTVLSQVEMVAATSTSVLILGESGTGKERIAEYIHELSPRRHRQLVKVNCAALPNGLTESILFGHEKGAFTGATERKLGKFEQAEGGTLFLDEIGELPYDVQAKFLRILQDMEFERLGSNETRKSNVRIVAATNRSLEKAVADGRFRMDLYFRLNTFPLHLPPLRERKDDIPVLAEHFLKLFSRELGRNISPLSNNQLDELSRYDWPGNIRELSNTLQRAILLSEGDTIRALPLALLNDEPDTASKSIKTIEEIERDYIIAILKRCSGKVSGTGGAADLLGLPASTLNFKIKRFNINKQDIIRNSNV
jgi:two-component system response regulator HydG